MWQPIETAPKDGTWIMLWEQYSRNPFIGRWICGRWVVSTEHVSAASEVVDDNLCMPITHWMPLPPSPENKHDA